MGCCYSLDDDESIISEESIVDFEKSLYIHKISMSLIEIEILKLKKSSQISLKNLNSFSDSLHIEKISNDYLVLLRLIKKKSSSYLKVVTFCILFGYSTKQEKINALFNYYDTNNKKELVENDIRLLIVNITEIFVNDISVCASYVQDKYEEELIIYYGNVLEKNKKHAIEFLLGSFINKKKNLTLNKFSEILKRPPMECLFNASLLRKFCYIINSKLREIIKECIETKDKLLFNKVFRKIIKLNTKTRFT